MNDLSQLLNEIILGNRLAGTIADEAGVSDDAVYASCSKRNNPNLDVALAAFVVTGDPRLKKRLTPRGWKLVPDSSQAEPCKDLESEAVDVTLASTGIVTKIRSSLENDGIIDADEARAIEIELQATEKEVAEVRAMLESVKKASKRPAMAAVK
jgi:hypothetical protein